MLALKTEQDQFDYIVQASPMPTSVIVGTDMVIAAANAPMLNIWGRGEDVIGLKLLNALPELVGQPFVELLSGVLLNGETVSATDVPADLRIKGELKRFYFSFIYKALKDEDGKTLGVLSSVTDVTELVLMKRQSAQAKEHLAFALNAAEIGTWNFDLVKNAITLDQGSLDLLGRENFQEVIYQELIDVIHTSDREKVIAAILEATTDVTAAVCDVNFRIYSKKNHIIWIRCKGKAYFAKDGTVERFSGIVQNISKEVNAQRELQRLAAIVNSSEDFCNYTDMEGNIFYINPAGKKLIGLDSGPIRHSAKFAYHDEASILKIESEVLPTLLKNGSWSGELTLINQKTNERIPIYKQFHLIKEKTNKTPICIAGIAKDLREELKVRKILADKNRDLQEIVNELEFLANTVPPVVWTSTPDGALDYINQRWYDQTGKSEAETLGFKWIDSVHPDDANAAGALWKQCLASGQLYEVEFRIITKDGSYRWFLVRALPLKHADDTIIKWYGTNTDIHNQKELEKQKDDFLAIASHELKTPVTSLKAYTQVMEAKFRKAGDQGNAILLSRMNKQMDRLTKLIDDLLNVTKITAGKLQLSLGIFNFKEMVEEVIEEVHKTASNHQIISKIEFDGEISSDRNRIYQVVVNLLTNAIKYSPQGDKIEVLVTGDKNQVQVSVKDFGIGIPADVKDRVFEQFYRVQGNSDQTFAGMGLGLYICADIIKRLGGKIWVNSVENEGSVFSFNLPLIR